MVQSSAYEIIPITFYQCDDVVEISRQLVGKYLFHDSEEGLLVGRIVETEAYNGRNDRACHAFQKRTQRTEVMYRSGGRVYVYLCYGIHHLFNIVTNVEGMADAVLIRALEPVEGIEWMRSRTGKKRSEKRLASGPGVLSKAMGFNKNQSGTILNENIWVANKIGEKPVSIISSGRIGVEYAGEDAKLPWRFMAQGNEFVSRK